MPSNNVVYESSVVNGEYVTIIRTKAPLKIEILNEDTVQFTAKTDYPFTFTHHKRIVSKL
jgi:hypothetical protein